MKQDWNIRDELYQEVHNMNPTWIMRWGITITTLFLLLLFAVSYVIKYPDVIVAEARLVSDVPSVTIPAPASTNITWLAVTDRQQVDQGDYLVVFQNNSNYQDIATLKSALDTMHRREYWINFFEQATNARYQLGEVQEYYDRLLEQLLEYYQINVQKKYDQEIIRLTKELKLYDQLGNGLNTIVIANAHVNELLDKNNLRDSLLLKGAIISEKDYSQRKQAYIESEKRLTQERLASERNQLESVKLRNTIANLRQVKREKLLALGVRIKESLSRLQSAIHQWEERYVLRAPHSGTVHLLLPIKQNQYVTAGEDLLVVIPTINGYNATLRIPFTGAGKIERGQRVNIKLNDYPHNEFGVLTGTIAGLSDVANQDHYLGRVRLDNYGRTSYNKEVIIRENTQGIAEVITEDRSWLARVFEKLIYLFRQ